MTPQPHNEAQPGQHLAGGIHLTDDQMSDLLAGLATSEVVTSHLDACAACTEEVASLREALSHFEETTVALADREFTRIQRPSYPVLPVHRAYPQTLLWAAACVALMLATILPQTMHRQQPASTSPKIAATPSAHTLESDEALLNDINREVSASVPDPMQALADPTGSSTAADSQTLIQASSQTSTQRKD